MPTYVSLAAVVGCLFLIVLYLSQRRDLARIQTWMEAVPNHPAEDMARSEALLDRAEAELEEILGVEAPDRPQTAVRPTDGGGTAPRAPRRPPASGRPLSRSRLSGRRSSHIRAGGDSRRASASQACSPRLPRER